MDGYFKLIRRIHTNNQIQPTGYLPWAERLLKYESSAIVNNTVYSKTEGIRTLLASVQESAADPDCNLYLAKAYLTDHGLLFPQTRKRFYDSPARSLKRNLFARMDQASYQPSLATEQEHAFLQQAEAFRNENLYPAGTLRCPHLSNIFIQTWQLSNAVCLDIL